MTQKINLSEWVGKRVRIITFSEAVMEGVIECLDNEYYIANYCDKGWHIHGVAFKPSDSWSSITSISPAPETEHVKGCGDSRIKIKT